jgi:protein-S-isoprenylcysteine O-methyltransferase Ste14
MGRGLVFIYGVFVYCAMLVTWLFAIAFVDNLDVIIPRTIDVGPTVSFAHAVIINALLLCLWTVPHSIMARQRFKAWWTKIVPPSVERSTFVLTATLLMMPMFHQWKPMPRAVWDIDNAFGYYMLAGLFWIGWFLAFYSTFLVDHFDLFGLRQVYNYLRRKEHAPIEFKSPGLYKYVRHPIMMSLIVVFWATPKMTVGHLMFATAMTGYILVGTILEERDLVTMYGETYEDYRRQVPMLLPLPGRQYTQPG